MLENINLTTYFINGNVICFLYFLQFFAEQLTAILMYLLVYVKMSFER